MKTNLAVLVLSLASFACLAQDAPDAREGSLRKIENTLNNTKVFTPDSPFLIGMIQSAKSANPGVPESFWQSVMPEFSASVSTALQNDGGATLRWLRVAFAQLSDSELEHVAQVYTDPVFVKSQASFASIASQREAARRAGLQAQLMSAGINAVLKKHGMNEVH